MSENGKVVVTLKGGKDFDAPWIVIHADNAAEARDLMGEVEQSGLLADVGRVAKGLKAQHLLGENLGARPVDAPGSYPEPAPQGSWGAQGTQQFAPQQQQQPQQGGWGGAQQGGGANPGDNKSCIHGPMKFQPAGVSRRTGNAYAAFWACGSNVKGCKAIN